jgi:hypothetical protein
MVCVSGQNVGVCVVAWELDFDARFDDMFHGLMFKFAFWCLKK